MKKYLPLFILAVAMSVLFSYTASAQPVRGAGTNIIRGTGLLTLSNGEIIDNSTDEVIGFSNGSLTLDIGLETTGNDNIQLGIDVGSATGSGYLSLMEDADMGNANRSPSGTSADPVLRVYSSDATQATDYIEMYHDQTNANIGVAQNTLKVQMTAGAGNGGKFVFNVMGSDMSGFFGASNYAQGGFGVFDNGGNQMLLTNGGNMIGVDHDHDTTTNPTLFIHSDLDADVSNNQWGSLAHDQENFVITTGVNTGTGTAATTDNNGIIFAPRGTEQARVETAGLRVAPPTAQTIAAGNTIAADACGGLKQITAAGAVTTSTTDTFTAPAATNTGCCMDVCNVGANNITLDNNANFLSIGGADIVMTANDCTRVCSNGTDWYSTGGLVAN